MSNTELKTLELIVKGELISRGIGIPIPPSLILKLIHTTSQPVY